MCHRPGLDQAGEDEPVQALVAETGVEALDKPVLLRLARRDIEPFDGALLRPAQASTAASDHHSAICMADCYPACAIPPSLLLPEGISCWKLADKVMITPDVAHAFMCRVQRKPRHAHSSIERDRGVCAIVRL